MLDKIQTHRLTGTIDGISFSGSDVIGVSYSNQCTGKKVNLGGVNIGTLKLTFLNNPLSRGDYLGKVITISDGLLLAPNTWEDIPIGTFYVSEAVWQASGMVDITAYDVLSLLDKPVTFNSTTGKLYEYCHYIEQETGAVFGLTEEETDDLPNGTEIVSLYPENNITTFRDLVSCLAEFIGGFAYADRTGTWKIKNYTSSSVVSVPKDRRISGAKFSDFETLYDTIQYTDIVNNTVKTVGEGLGLVLNLGKQPFLQYGLPEVINSRASNIAEAIEVMAYTPFSVSLLPAFVALDLGDVITFASDYADQTTEGAVMSVNWIYNKSFKVECYGENPNLRTAQSATDKNIAGLLSKSNDNTIRYYTYVNIADHEGIETEETIASFHFATNIDTTVTIWEEIQADFSLDDETEPMQVIFHYYLNNVEEPYTPIQTISASGVHTLDYNYFLQGISGGLRNEWLVTMECIGGSAAIDEGNIHICLSGQGLVGEEAFIGIIEVSDTIPNFIISAIEAGAFTEAVSVSANTDIYEAPTDNISIYDITDRTSSDFSEVVSVILVLDESFSMFCGDGFYCGDDMATGFYNTLI